MNQSITKLALKLSRYQSKIEWVLMVAFMMGIFFRKSEAGSVLVELSLGGLGTVYFILSFAEDVHGSRIMAVLKRVIYTSFSIGIIGIIFTIKHFPNAESMLMVALITMILGLVFKTILQFRIQENPKAIDSDLIRVVVILLVMAAFMLYRPLTRDPFQSDQLNTEQPTEIMKED